MWCLIVTTALGLKECFGPFPSAARAKQWGRDSKLIGEVAILTFVNND